MAVWAGGDCTKYVCSIRQDGARGACDQYGIPWGGTYEDGNPKTSSTYPDYAKADANLKLLIQKIQSCTADANTPIPPGWILAGPPDPAAPNDVKSAWDSYSLRLDMELKDARDNAGAFCQTGTNGNRNVSPGYGNQPTCGYNSYGQPMPCAGQIQYPQSAIVPGGTPDLYGGEGQANDIYTHTGGPQVTYPEGGSTIAPNPFAPTTHVANKPMPVRHTKRNAGIAGVLVILGGVVLLSRRRSSRRSRSR